MFTENLVKYKAYLLASGYASDRIDKHFIKVAELRRKDVLDGKAKCTNRKLGAKKISFVTTWDPMFQNINQAIKKFQHISEEDDLCKQLFPKGTFRVPGGGGHMSKFIQGCSSYFFGFEIWPNLIFLGWQIF